MATSSAVRRWCGPLTARRSRAPEVAMFAYYLDLARRSLRRNRALTVLMIVAIAFGVGASMTTLTVLHVLSVDPIPGKSHQLYNVQLEPRRLLGFVAGREPLEQMTRLDSETLLRAAA